MSTDPTGSRLQRQIDRPRGHQSPVTPAGGSQALGDVPDAERAGEAQDGRTTAEWIAHLVKARQAAEADRGVLAARVARVEEAGDLSEAIARIEESRQTHVEWADYWATFEVHLCTTEPCPWEAAREATAAIAGDDLHQRECIKGYDNVLAILRTLADPEPAQVRQADEPLCAHCGKTALGYARGSKGERLCHDDERSCYTIVTQHREMQSDATVDLLAALQSSVTKAREARQAREDGAS